MTQVHANLRDWHTPADLQSASFNDPIIATTPAPTQQPINQPTQDTPLPPPQPRFDSGLIDKLLPLIGKINNGGLDITTMLDLFDKSGQGLGALGKLLPIISPLLSGLNGKNGFKKQKAVEDTIDYNSINLDN